MEGFGCLGQHSNRTGQLWVMGGKRLFALLVLWFASVLVFGQVSLPYSEDFDGTTPGNPGTLPSGWVNVATDGSSTCSGGGASGHTTCHNWQVNTGATPSVSPIGPNSDHTSGSGNYIYYEDSTNSNSTVEILTPTFNLSGTTRPRVSFYLYHHHFGGTGTPNDLSLDVMNAAGTTVITSDLVVYNDSFQVWLFESEDLSAYTGSGTIRLRFRVNLNGAAGRNDIAIDDFSIADDPAPVLDPAECTPIDNSRGALFSTHNDGIYSINLTTGKATLLTTTPVSFLNSLAVDPVNELVYYVETIATTTALLAWDYGADQHITIASDLSDYGIIVGSSVGVGGGAGTWSDGSLFLGIEEGDDGELNDGLDLVYRLDFVPGSGGLTPRGGRLVLQINDGGNHDWGDFVAIGGNIYDFSPNTAEFGVFDISTGNFTVTGGVNGLSQSGADRLGGLWSVASTIQRRSTANGATIGSATNITTNGTTGISIGSYDAAGCVPANNEINSVVWHDTDGDGVIDGSEPGISGVTLNVYDDINGNGQIDGGDAFLGTTVTAADGSYSFTNLLPGDYIVEVDESTLPMGSTNTFDEDDGTSSPDGMTGVFVTLNDDYGTADFGYLVPTGITADKTVVLTNDADGSGSITEGDTLTYTIVLQNTNQGGVATGVTVTDVVPSGLNYVGSSIAGGDASNDSDPDGSIGGAPDGLQWTVNGLNPGATENLSFEVTVGFGTAGSTIDNQADVTGSNFANSESDDPSDPTNDPSGPGDTADPTSVDVVSPDTDRDGVPDNIDVDDDNDGIPDVNEGGGNNPVGDEDGDGIPNWQDTFDDDPGDTLGDGSVTDYFDNDGNGIPDVFDHDGDGLANHLDIDADNDGIPDLTEAGGTDSDNDGIVDEMYDTDGDGIPDSVDVDQTGGADNNADGIDDAAQGGADSDGDGIQNADDPDADGDGFADSLDDIDNGGPGEITSGTPLSNGDSDMDGLPNALDIDADDDGIPDNIETQPSQGYVPPTGLDSDGDGLDNAYDPDTNYASGSNDGPGTPLPITNTDGTDSPDYLDDDSDNDNIPDIRENGDSDNVLSGIDSDNDGLDDNFEGANSDDPDDPNDDIDDPTSDLPDGDSDLNSGGDLDYRDSVDLDSFTDNGYGSLDEVYYRQTNGSIDEFYVGGPGFPATDANGYDVAYYDSQGDLVFTDTDATVDGNGFIESEFTVADGLDSNDLNYGTWTAVTLFDGVSPAATLAAQQGSGTSIVSDTFDVFSIATIQFTDNGGTPVPGYDVPGGEDTAYLEVVDPDQNSNPGAVDSISVTVTDSETGDMVVVTLFETGVDTGIFAFSTAGSGTRLGIPLSICPGVPPAAPNTGDGTICVTPVSSLEATYTDPNDPGSVQDVVTNPVTINAFSTHLDARAGEWVIRWSTSTETGNMGFHIYALKGNQLERLTPMPIPSKVVDSVDLTNYEWRMKGDLGEALVIEDIDIFGARRGHGPFAVNEDYGRVQPESAIDWRAIRGELAVQMRMREEQARGLLRGSVQPESQAIYLKTTKPGVYRISYEALLAAGIDLQSVNATWLALTNRGEPVPIYLGYDGKGTSFEPRLGPGAFLEFVAQEYKSLYSETNVYKLAIDPDAVLRIAQINAVPTGERKPIRNYRETSIGAEENQYSFSAPNGDPWFAESLLAWGGPFEKDLDIQLSQLDLNGGALQLELGLWGVTDWPTAPDHHVRVFFNGVLVEDLRFDGLVNQPVSLTIPDGLAVEGHNQVTLQLPLDTGQEYDLVNLDHWKITYPRKLAAREGGLTFKAGSGTIEVTGLEGAPTVYSMSPQGKVHRLANIETVKSGKSFTARFVGSATEATYYLVDGNGFEEPTIGYISTDDTLMQGNGEYLIIAHPSFMGPVLGQLANLRRANGYGVKVVDVLSIYDTFGHGFASPDAIRGYIRYAHQNLGTEMVLLVGGDTYDYLDHIGQDAVSFIPTFYTQTDDIVRFAPADALFADLNQDNIPDLAIGRIPVRTGEELSIQIEKILTYEAQDRRETALFVADVYDGYQGYSFSQDSDDMADLVPDAWMVSKLYLDNLSVGQARNFMIDAVELGLPLNGNHGDLRPQNRTGGVGLVSFAGHSGPKDWTFSGLFGSGDAAQLVNSDHPAMFVQWGCWNTYFVSPNENTLGHTLMLNPNGGAVGVLGAATLTEAGAERQMALLLYRKLFQPGMSLGEAVLRAKREFAGQHPKQLDVILGWTTLADPALIIQP